MNSVNTRMHGATIKKTNSKNIIFTITGKYKLSHTVLYLDNCPERHKVFDVGNCLTVNWVLLLMELSGAAL